MKKLLSAVSVLLSLITVTAVMSSCVLFGKREPQLIYSDETFHRYDDITVRGTAAEFDKPSMPKIDGSTATVTLHAAIAAYNNPTHVYIEPKHSQTYGALGGLSSVSSSPVDMVLSSIYYDKHLVEIEKKGVELIITPVAKEGFIFVVTKDNPINALTSAQIRDIYSGKIKNWSEVGGNDKKIRPFQRNPDSGSQTAMLWFMGERPMLQDLETHIGMGQMIEGLASMGETSLGFTAYSWGNKKILEENELKIIAVGGVMPSDQTISSGEYPLINYTYSYYNKGNEAAEKMTDWLLTAEGQSVVASAGFVGLYGELPPERVEKFDRDREVLRNMGLNYLKETLSSDYKTFSAYSYITDFAIVLPLADGLERDITAAVVYICYYEEKSERPSERKYVVMTRAIGGAYTVIAYGEYVK